jgi:hypothetical protein
VGLVITPFWTYFANFDVAIGAPPYCCVWHSGCAPWIHVPVSHHCETMRNVSWPHVVSLSLPVP